MIYDDTLKYCDMQRIEILSWSNEVPVMHAHRHRQPHKSIGSTYYTYTYFYLKKANIWF